MMITNKTIGAEHRGRRLKVPGRHEAVVIGVSAGGLKALKTILPVLPKDYAYPIFVVVHRYPKYQGDHFERFLDSECQIRVKQAENFEKAEQGTAYFAPPDRHMSIREDGTLALHEGEYVNFARPSVDVLFESAAAVYKDRLIGAVLTGANNDGSRGLGLIKNAGGLTIVQAPETAEVDIMPRAAIAIAKPDFIIQIKKMGHFLAGTIECGTDLPEYRGRADIGRPNFINSGVGTKWKMADI